MTTAKQPSDYDLIKMLYDFGHFFSPEALEFGLVEEEDLHKLDLDDAIVQAAVRSYQQFLKPDLDRLTQRGTEFGGLKRPAIPDGIVGPNTRELLTMPRCGRPDFKDPRNLVEEASWPDACRKEITTSYRMALGGLSAEKLSQLWVEADGHWSKVLDVEFFLDLPAYPNTRVYAFAATLGGSVLADQYLATGNCGSRLQGRFDTRTWDEVLFVTTVTHEHGHALGCGHLQDSAATMYPSITQASMSRRGAPNASDLQAMLQLGYKRRETPPPPEGWKVLEYRGNVTEIRVKP